MLSLLTGLINGFIHVLTGPDHLAAVAPLNSRGGRGGWRTGLKWGFGHASGVVVVGLLALFARAILPIEKISDISERLVGVLLVGIGFWGLRKAAKLEIHVHEHAHDGSKHSHIHFHSPSHDHSNAKSHQHGHAAFGIGTLHGLAGSSHILGILPALAFKSDEMAMAYLVFFGLGTLAAMALFSELISRISSRLAKTRVRIFKMLNYGFSLAAVVIGVYWFFSN
jgi:sulfite exporter TauE/SafE